MLWSTLALLPQVNNMIWTKAKEMAVAVEMYRSCAQIRISSLFRKLCLRRSYLKNRDAVTCIARNIRCKIAWMQRKSTIQQARNDRTFRIQFQYVITIQKYWRLFYCRKCFYQYKQHQKVLELQNCERHWQELRKKKQYQVASLIFKKTLRIQSVLTITKMILKEKPDLDQSTQLQIFVYVPETRTTFNFFLSQLDLQKIHQKAFQTDEFFSWNEMMQENYLSILTRRLMSKNVSNCPIILFSRRDVAEKGILISKQPVKFSETFYILSIYRSLSDIAIIAYDPKKRKQTRREITMIMLMKWLNAKKKIDRRQLFSHSLLLPNNYTVEEVYGEKESDRDSRDTVKLNNTVENELLNENSQDDLILWLIQRMLIKNDDCLDQLKIVLKYESEEEEHTKIAMKIQSMWRSKCAQQQTKKNIHNQFEKAFDRTTQEYIYINTITGISQWTKPVMLGSEDIKDPADEWRSLEHIDQQNVKKTFFTNLYTGQSSWLSEEDAVRLLQKKFRERRLLDLLGPKLNFCQVVKAVTIMKESEKNYERSPEKLSNCVNFAILNHCVRLNTKLARKLYKDAIEQSPFHPVIARAYGIFILSTCTSPQEQTFKKAHQYFKQAASVDPNHIMFQSALNNYFYWAVLMQPRNPLTLLNYALVHQCVLCNYDRAEIIYRRALGEDKENYFVFKNYELFQEQRYPGGVYASKGPSPFIVSRSKVIEERPEWGEWQKMKDPICLRTSFQCFFYNTLKKNAYFDEPNWEQILDERIKRSTCISTNSRAIWVEYFDNELKMKFLYNSQTRLFSKGDNSTITHTVTVL